MKNIALPEIINKTELFEGLSKEDVFKIATICSEKIFKKNSRVFSEGDSPDTLYLLEKGYVKIVSLSEGGKETILNILSPGDIFGEFLLVADKRPFDAVVVQDAGVLVITKEALMQLITSQPTVALNFIKILSKRLIETKRLLADFSHTWSYHRLARTLIKISELHGREVPGGTLITLRLTHEGLANMIGTSRETVTMQLKRLKRMDIIKIQNRHIIIINRNKLINFLLSEDKQ